MSKFPASLLQDVCWSFAEPVAASSEAFLEAARAYALDIGSADPGPELERSLEFSDVRLGYEYSVQSPAGDWETRKDEVRVVGSRGGLTGADLLWELHLACHTTVGEDDHHFFEGLELQSAGASDEPRLYQVLLGS